MVTKLNNESDLLNIKSYLYIFLATICALIVFPGNGVANNVSTEFREIFFILLGYYLLLLVFTIYSSFKTASCLINVRAEEKHKEKRITELEKAIEVLNEQVKHIIAADN